VGLAQPERVSMSELLTIEDFAAHLNPGVRVDVPGDPDLELVEIRDRRWCR
jgi:hypothetical protein